MRRNLLILSLTLILLAGIYADTKQFAVQSTSMTLVTINIDNCSANTVVTETSLTDRNSLNVSATLNNYDWIAEAGMKRIDLYIDDIYRQSVVTPDDYTAAYALSTGGHTVTVIYYVIVVEWFVPKWSEVTRRTVTVHMDQTAPVITLTGTNGENWSNNPAGLTVEAGAIDTGGTGVNSNTWEYKLSYPDYDSGWSGDGSANNRKTITRQGETTVSFRVMDNVGNEGSNN